MYFRNSIGAVIQCESTIYVKTADINAKITVLDSILISDIYKFEVRRLIRLEEDSMKIGRLYKKRE